MSDSAVLSARASSLEKLEKELTWLLADRSADDVLAVSHTAAGGSGKQSGGVWGGAKMSQQVEYSVVVVVRSTAEVSDRR